MCLIIHKPQGVDIPTAHIDSALRKNPDGWGLMLPTDGGGVRIVKSLKPMGLRKHLSNATGECLLHFRLATHGTTDFENLHPYHVVGAKQKTTNIWLMHNGVIPGTGAKPRMGKSDTALYIEDYLRPILVASEAPQQLLSTPAFLSMIASHIGGNNRMVFWGDRMPVCFVNHAGGKKFPTGLWYSNTYAWEDDSRPNPMQAPMQVMPRIMGRTMATMAIKGSAEPIPLFKGKSASPYALVSQMLNGGEELTDDLLNSVEMEDWLKLVQDHPDEVAEFLFTQGVFEDKKLLLTGLGVYAGLLDWPQSLRNYEVKCASPEPAPLAPTSASS